jgi:hypothetical protein
MKIGDIVKVFPDGIRRNVGVDEENPLMSVNFKEDLLTTPKDLIRQFVNPKSIDKFNQVVPEFQITSSTDNEDLSNYILETIRKLGSEKLEFDRRLENINPKSIRGYGYYYEQYTLSFGNLNDTQFGEMYKYFIEELRRENPVAVTFVSKSDINKTITVTNNTKLIHSTNINSPLSLSYSQRGEGLVNFSSSVTSKKANPMWTHIGRSMFTAIDKIGLNLIIDRGSNKNSITKSTFFEKYELTAEDLEKEQQIKEIVSLSNSVESFDNNTKRGSMSPNSSEKYIKDKNINEEVFEIQSEGAGKVKDIIDAESVTIKDSPDLDESKDNVSVLVESSASDTKEVDKVEEPKNKEPMKNKEKEEESLLDKVLSEFDIVTEKEILAIDQAFERKKLEAKELSIKMLNDFKTNIALGGTLQSNLEKINQSYRDNEYAVTLFGVLAKNELLKSVAKDNIIKKYNENINVLNSNIENTKEKYEQIISTYTAKIKKIEEDLTKSLSEKDELESEFDEYVTDSSTKFEELRTSLEEAKKNLEEMEAIKALDEEKNNFIGALETKISILEKEHSEMKGQLNGFDTLKNLASLQTKNLAMLEKENDSLKDKLDLQNKSTKELEELVKTLRATNQKLEEKLKSFDSKIEIADEIKKELRVTNKISRELNKKEEFLSKKEKEISYLRPLTTLEIEEKIKGAEENSLAWHRLNIIKLPSIDFSNSSWKAMETSRPDFLKDVVNIVKDLEKAELMYKTQDGVYRMKEKAKNIIFENINESNEFLADEFKRNSYIKPEDGDYNPNGGSRVGVQKKFRRN